MWPDNETDTDLLGFEVHANLLKSVVTDASMLPVTIGVFGDWGGGKTSIMKMLERNLDPERYAAGSQLRAECDTVATVYVNTWQFEGYDDAKAALISSVLLELKDHTRFGPKVSAGVLKLLRSVNWFRFGRLTLKHVALPATAAFLTGGAAAVPAALAAAVGLSALLPGKAGQDGAAADSGAAPDLDGLLTDDADKSVATDVRAFRREFEGLLKTAGITTLVVLVDDLDRCSPERLLENLEAIKLFLSVDRTAFVIGADPRIVEHAIRYRYAEKVTHNADETAQLVKDYLEKLVQLPYTLPRLSPSEIESYMVLLFCRINLGDDDYGRCRATCDANRVENRYRTFGFGEVQALLGKANVSSTFATSLQFCASAATVIAETLKGNPRQVKRFLNAFILRKKLATVARLDDIRDDVLMKLMILEYAHGDRFRDLFKWQAEANGFPTALATLETDPTGSTDSAWTTPEIKKWLAIEPTLATVDLRNYFWIARDRLASTFTGVSLVSPAVRRLFEDSLLTPKRHAAAATARTLPVDELNALFGLLEQTVHRSPSDTGAYEALRYLADTDVPGAVDAYARVLTGVAADAIPPAVGLAALTLMESKPALRPTLEPAVASLRTSSRSRVGKAIENAESKAGRR